MYFYISKNIKIVIAISVVCMLAGYINLVLADVNLEIKTANYESNILESDSSFDGTIILGRPTFTTMDISIMSNKNYSAYLIWTSDDKSDILDKLKFENGIPETITIVGLPKGEKVSYRLYYKATDEVEFRKTKEYTFQLPRNKDESFSFIMQSDSHLLNKADRELYKNSMEMSASLNPDFFLDLGDTFLNDQYRDAYVPSTEDVENTYIEQRPYFDIVTREAPLYLTIGNHEGEYGSFFDGTLDNVAAKSTLARTKYYINPIPNEFYSGNDEKEELFGHIQNYFSYTWGDVLFVSIDPYRYSDVVPYVKNRSGGSAWDWTLGKEQYDWFKNTLEDSDAKYKIVTSHHAIGNMRGGENIAHLYEWGGYDRNGKYLFDKMRIGWEKPIHQIMEDEGVSAFFQGHDHLFAREQVDHVTYVTIPKPAEKIADIQTNHSEFSNGDSLMNSGILNVNVTPENIKVDYIRNFLVATSDGESKTGIVYSFTINPDRNVEVLKHVEDDFETYGSNDESLAWKYDDKAKNGEEVKENKEKLESKGDRGKKINKKKNEDNEKSNDYINSKFDNKPFR